MKAKELKEMLSKIDDETEVQFKLPDCIDDLLDEYCNCGVYDCEKCHLTKYQGSDIVYIEIDDDIKFCY